MTRAGLVILLASSFSSLAFAQGDDMRTLRHAETAHTWVGLRGGVTISNESVPTALDASTSSLTAFQGGLQVDEWLSNMFAVSIAATIDKKGIKESYPPSSKEHPAQSGDDQYSFSYLEIPIVLRAAFGNGDARPYVFAGPSIGLLTSAEETVSDPSIKPSSTDIKGTMNSTDFSLFLGGGFLDKLSEHFAFSIDLGYALGLTKIYKVTFLDSDRPALDKSNNPVYDSNGKQLYLINNSDAKSGDFRAAASFLFGF